MKLVTELVPHQHVLNARTSLLLLNLSSVSLVVLYGFFEDELEVICMCLLLFGVFQLVSSLHTLHCPKLLLELTNAIEDQKGLL